MDTGLMSFIGGGDLYMDRLAADGSSQGFVKVGNATKFELKVDSETKKQLARGRDNFGQTLASVTRITGSTIGITLDQIDKDVLAAVFLGSAVERTGAGGSITNEAISAKLGKMVELAHANISAVTVTDATGITTYVAGTDYVVHDRLGLIEILVSGSITEGESLLVDYTWAAESGYKITGATQPVVKAALKLDGKNDYDGKPVLVNVFAAQLRPSSAVDFLAEDFAQIVFEGDLLTPTGKSWPFEVI